MNTLRNTIWVKMIALSIAGVFCLSQLAWIGLPTQKQISCLYHEITSFLVPTAHAAELEPLKTRNNQLLPVLNTDSEWKTPSDTVDDTVPAEENQEQGSNKDQTLLQDETQVTSQAETGQVQGQAQEESGQSDSGIKEEDQASVDTQSHIEQYGTGILGGAGFVFEKEDSYATESQDKGYQELRSQLTSPEAPAKKEQENAALTPIEKTQNNQLSANKPTANNLRIIEPALNSFETPLKPEQTTTEPAPIQAEEIRTREPKLSTSSFEDIETVKLEEDEPAPAIKTEQVEPTAVAAAEEQNEATKENTPEENQEPKAEALDPGIAKELNEPEQTEEAAKPRKQDKVLFSISGYRFLIPPLENVVVPLAQTQATPANNGPKIESAPEPNFALAVGNDNVLKGNYIGENTNKRIEEIYTANPPTGPPKGNTSNPLPIATAPPNHGPGNSALYPPAVLNGITPVNQQAGILTQGAILLPNNIDLALVHNHGPPL